MTEKAKAELQLAFKQGMLKMAERAGKATDQIFELSQEDMEEEFQVFFAAFGPLFDRLPAKESNFLADKGIVEELAFLRWFYEHADFGPATDDIRRIMKEEYRGKTGNPIPGGQ